jgi:hypothetical protein
LKKQNQSRLLAGNPKFEYLNPKLFEGCVLKKQSQFNRSEFCVLRSAKWNLKKQSQSPGLGFSATTFF